jgi:hypothetical protein
VQLLQWETNLAQDWAQWWDFLLNDKVSASIKVDFLTIKAKMTSCTMKLCSVLINSDYSSLVHQRQFSGFQPFIITHFNGIISTFHNWF